MPITTKTIIDRINYKIEDPNTSIDDINKLTTIAGLLQDSSVISVDTELNLPSASLNNGRLFFVKSLSAHRYSNGKSWQPLASSIPAPASVIWASGSALLGDNTAISRSSPVSVVGGFTDWCQVSAGDVIAAAIRTNGTLWTWGSGPHLGDNTSVAKSSPVQVAGGFTDWCQVSTTRIHTAAIRTNGTLWTWGDNSRSQLGHGTATTCSRSSPVIVVGGFTDWRQVGAGTYHTAAIRSNGTLWTWGYNGSGQLGDNTIANKSSPVSVVGVFTDWCQVSAGAATTAAIRTNGTIWAWGCNASGQLGDNSVTARSSPVSVVGGFTDWCQVSAGSATTAAIRSNGTLWTWGGNGYGSLGYNTAATCSRSSPVSVVGGFTDWCQVSSGRNSTVAALRTNGTLWTWGGNSNGQLGHNTAATCSRSSPVNVVGGFTDWCQVSVGHSRIAATRFVT